MRTQYPKLCNMTHTLPLSVSITFKGTNFQIFILRIYGRQEEEEEENIDILYLLQM